MKLFTAYGDNKTYIQVLGQQTATIPSVSKHPLKGVGNKRKDLPSGQIAKAFYFSLPEAHRDVIMSRSAKGGYYSEEKVISVEAYNAYEKCVQKLRKLLEEID